MRFKELYKQAKDQVAQEYRDPIYCTTGYADWKELEQFYNVELGPIYHIEPLLEKAAYYAIQTAQEESYEKGFNDGHADCIDSQSKEII